jgi:hypothetical protein
MAPMMIELWKRLKPIQIKSQLKNIDYDGAYKEERRRLCVLINLT